MSYEPQPDSSGSRSADEADRVTADSGGWSTASTGPPPGLSWHPRHEFDDDASHPSGARPREGRRIIFGAEHRALRALSPGHNYSIYIYEFQSVTDPGDGATRRDGLPGRSESAMATRTDQGA